MRAESQSRDPSILVVQAAHEAIRRHFIDADVMISQRWKDIALDALQTQAFSRAPGHVTVDAVLGEVDAFLGKEAAITFAFVTGHATAGK